MMIWKKFTCNPNELQLLGTLNGGQSFRWTYNKENDDWTGIFAKTVWKLRHTKDTLQYQILGTLLQNALVDDTNKKSDNENIYEMLLKKYFRLDMNLTKYFEEWSEKDELFKSSCKQFYGIRMLAQEPTENVFSFICSQNNHISRISSMVEKLCTFYGEEICEHNGVKYYSFPEVEMLAEPKVESRLRDLGFGYRAKFIQKSAAQIVEWGGAQWFNSLQEMKYKEARQELMKLCGIGPKEEFSPKLIHKCTLQHKILVDIESHDMVADCICLMSLNHLEALPVDTHVYQIAAQNYLPHLRGKKNVTDKMYTEIGDHFRNLYGDMAGWAHTVLFCADLKKFQNTENCDDVEKGKPIKKRRHK